MPYTQQQRFYRGSQKKQAEQELQVRLTAQNILSRNLRRDV